MQRTYKLLKFKAKFLAYFLLLGILVYVVAGRFLLSQLPQYRLDLQQYLSSELNVPVEVDQLVAKWSGFDPILEIRGISINGAGNAHIKSAQIKFAFLQSLLDQAPKIKAVRLDTLSLAVEQRDEGAWSLAGIDLSGLTIPEASGAGGISIEDVLDGADLQLVDAFIRLSSPNAEEKVWRLPSSSLRYAEGKVYAQGSVIRPDGLQPLARFVYNSESIDGASVLSGKLFVEARSSRFLDNLLRTYTWRDLYIEDVDASGRVWIDLSGLRVESFYADVQFHRLNWKSRKKNITPLTNSAVSFAWHGNDHGARFDLYSLDYNWEDKSCSVPGAVFESIDGHIDLSLETLDLACTTDLALSLGLLEGRLAQRLDVGDPTGRLNKLWLSLNPDDLSSLRLQAELEEVSIQAFDGAPKLGGVNGYINTSAASGYVDFKSNTFELSFPDLYLDGWASHDANGRVTWAIDGDDVDIASEGLSIKLFDDAEVFGDFLLRLNDEDHEDYLGLMLGVKNVALPDVKSLVPYHLVEKSLHFWLSESLVGGSVASGMYFGYGSIESNSPDNSFTSSLAVETDQASLKFDPEWPAVDQLNLELSLHEDRLAVHAKDATIKTAPVTNLSVNMPGVSAGQPDPLLNVFARIETNTGDYDYWLGESPVSPKTQVLHDLLRFEGKGFVDLQLALLLTDELETEFVVDFTAENLNAKHTGSHIKATGIKGKVTVDSEKGVSASGIELDAFGFPAKLNINANPLTDTTVVELEGRAAVESLFPDDFGLGSVEIDTENAEQMKPNQAVEPWHYGLSGASDFDARIEIPNDPALSTQLRLKTDLAGIHSDWPVPLGKSLAAKNNAELLATFKPKQTNVQISLNGAALPESDSELLFIDGEFQYGRVVLSSETNELTLSDYAFSGDNLGVFAQVSDVNVEDWVDYVAQNFATSKNDDSPRLLTEIRVNSEQVDVFGSTVKKVNALIKPELNDMEIELSGDNTTGRIVLASGDEPIQIDMETLRIEPQAEDAQKGETLNGAVLDPRLVADMKFSAKDIWLGKDRWGAWSFWTETDEQGLIFRDLKGQVAGSSFSGQLTWQHDEGQSHTILTMKTEGEDVAPILALFGQDSPMSSEEYTSDLALVWPDAPHNFSLAHLSGSTKLSFENGVISTENDATGALRLFGIFSLDALARRLRLDFSDLYKSGISFDELTVNATIDQGDMRFVDPLVINGPSSNYRLRGSIDLEKQLLDLKMLVELPIASNVPIAALMLGNPVVGGAVWLVDKILGQPLAKLSTVRYGIKGSWENPEMVLEQAVNAK